MFIISPLIQHPPLILAGLIDAASRISVVYTLNQAYPLGTVHLVVPTRPQFLFSFTGATRRAPWPTT